MADSPTDRPLSYARDQKPAGRPRTKEPMTTDTDNWTRILTTTIPGQPRGQGSMTLATNPRTGRGYARYSTPVIAHRNLAVTLLAQAWTGHDTLTGPTKVRIDAYLPRPATHWGTGRNTHRLRPSAPQLPHTGQDVDKIARLICDALTVAGVWRDDSQAVEVHAAKHYCPTPGEVGHTDVEVWA